MDEQQKPLEQSQNLHFNIFKDAEVKSRPLWYLISACTPAVLTDITVLFSGLPPKEFIVTGTLCKTFLCYLLYS